MKLDNGETLNLTPTQRKEAFAMLIAPKIRKRESMADCAAEYIHLRELYGETVTQKAYAEAKGIGEPPLCRALSMQPGYTAALGKRNRHDHA